MQSSKSKNKYVWNDKAVDKYHSATWTSPHKMQTKINQMVPQTINLKIMFWQNVSLNTLQDKTTIFFLDFVNLSYRRRICFNESQLNKICYGYLYFSVGNDWPDQLIANKKQWAKKHVD